MNTVHDTTNAAKDKAAEVGSQVSDQAKSQVGTRTTEAGDAIQDKADGLHQMSDQLRDSGQDAFAQLAEKAATLTEDAARYLRNADADSIRGDVEGFARRSPWAVAAGGMLLGFAASRLVKAGTDNRTSAVPSRATPEGTVDFPLSQHDLTTPRAAGSTPATGVDDTGYATGTTGPAHSTAGYEPRGGIDGDR